jgi:hypothetical protein
MRLKVWTPVALLLTTASVVTGCHVFGSRDPVIERWSGPVSELRAQWTSAPGIDLLAGPAVPIRAYLESRWLAQWVGNIDYAYPGFTEAVPPDVDDSPDIGARQRRPIVKTQISAPFIGNDHFRILSIDDSGRDLTATVCNYTYAISKKNDDGTYSSAVRSQTREPKGIFAERISLVASTTQTEPALPPQEGPAAAPSVDVFGGWQIVGNLASISRSLPGFDEAWPAYDADTQACVDQAPDPPARIAFLVNGNHPREDFPTSTPSPGWPEKSS